MPKCMLGCPLGDGTRLHAVPEDPVRRAEWLRIINVDAKSKKLYLCSKHFSNVYLFGNKTSRYAIPDRNLQPYVEKETNMGRHGHVNNSKQTLECVTGPKEQTLVTLKQHIPEENSTEKGINFGSFNYYKSVQHVQSYFPPKKQTFIKRKIFTFPRQSVTKKYISAFKKQDQQNLTWNMKDIQYAEEDVAEVEVTTQNDIAEDQVKVEDFEMCSGTSKDTILKGRYVQLKDYLVVSYTTPTTLRLKEKVDRLNIKCDEQAKEIKRMKSENRRLYKEVLRYKKLLRKLKNSNKKKILKFSNTISKVKKV